MVRFNSIDKTVEFLTAGIDPKTIGAGLAAFAKATLRNEINEGRASSRYNKYVNGSYNVAEERVVPPGPIYYEFQWWPEIITSTLEILMKRSPVLTSRYQKSFRVMVNGSYVERYDDIPIGTTVSIVNTQPYSRKIEVGHMRMRVPDSVVEDAMIIARRRFGNMVKMKFRMINIPNPYILKGVFKRGYKPGARRKIRRDVEKGTQMTYPAIEMTMI